MKKMISLLILCTTPLVFANTSKDYIYESVSCSVAGAELSPESSLLLEAEVDVATVNTERTQIELKQNVEGQAQTKSFRLNQVGKSSFMALPVIVTAEMTQFFVTFDDEKNEIEISRSDFMNTHCEGGLIIKVFSVERPATSPTSL